MINLFENYPLIKKWDLHKYFTTEQIKWLDQQLETYNQSKTKYLEQISQLNELYESLKERKWVPILEPFTHIHGDGSGVILLIFIAIILLIITYWIVSAVGDTMAKKTLKVFDPNFLAKPYQNQHLDLYQHLSSACQNVYKDSRKIILNLFEMQWANKQKEFLAVDELDQQTHHLTTIMPQQKQKK